MNVFVDTSYYIARTLSHDQWRDVGKRAIRPGMTYVTSAPVINETISLLQQRGLLSTALVFLAGIRSSPEVQIVQVDPILQSEAWDLFHKLAGSGANAVDCISFAIMRRLSIKKAFTFDRHFQSAGFEILR